MSHSKRQTARGTDTAGPPLARPPRRTPRGVASELTWLHCTPRARLHRASRPGPPDAKTFQAFQAILMRFTRANRQRCVHTECWCGDVLRLEAGHFTIERECVYQLPNFDCSIRRSKRRAHSSEKRQNHMVVLKRMIIIGNCPAIERPIIGVVSTPLPA